MPPIAAHSASHRPHGGRGRARRAASPPAQRRALRALAGTLDLEPQHGGAHAVRPIFVKGSAAVLRARELRRVRPGEAIAIGAATDPYQPAERHYEITRALLEVLAEYPRPDLEIGIITKSALITRDLELLRAVAARHRLQVRLTITTLDTDLARKLEPRAPRPDLRLKAVEQLSAAGLWVGVMGAPVLPAITDRRANLEAVGRAAHNAGAQALHAGALYLHPAARARYLPFVREHFSHLSARYEHAYGVNTYVPPEYQHPLGARVNAVRAACGFVHRIDRHGPQRGRAARPAYARAGPRSPYAPAQPARLARPGVERRPSGQLALFD